ncbi:MAG: ABC transporter permease [bacterium]
MRIWESLRAGLKSLLEHKLRAALTILGIVFAVATCLAVGAILNGAKVENLKILTEIGGYLNISVSLLPREEYKREDPREWPRVLDYFDYRLFCEEDSLFEGISPVVRLFLPVKYRDKVHTYPLYGVVPDFQKVEDHWVEEGRFITHSDLESCRKVCVLGQKIKAELFAGENPQIVEIEDEAYVVVGVMQNKEMVFGDQNILDWKNKIIFIPLTTAQKRLTGKDELSYLHLQAKSMAVVDQAAKRAREILRKTHLRADKFDITTAKGILDRIEKSMKLWTIVLGSLVSISFVVGGIGITNIMLTSVMERTSEIGIRRAVGARKVDIFLQFLTEAFLLGFIGGEIGLGIGASIIQTVNFFLKRSELSNTMVIFTAGMAMFSLSFCLLVGLLSGLYPAIKAARLTPMETIRYE